MQKAITILQTNHNNNSYCHLNFIHNINYMKDLVNLIDLINGCCLSLTSISMPGEQE